jgi:hypothetical protein
MAETWIPVTTKLPPSGEVVETKIDDHKDTRNVQKMKRLGGLYFFPDGSMYAYYTPTHWRPAPEEPSP